MHLWIIVYLNIMLLHSINLSFTYNITGITADEVLRRGGLLESVCTVTFLEGFQRDTVLVYGLES